MDQVQSLDLFEQNTKKQIVEKDYFKNKIRASLIMTLLIRSYLLAIL